MGSEIKIGTWAECSQCGGVLVWKGEHWAHADGSTPRHPAIPLTASIGATGGMLEEIAKNLAPVQPAWTKELDSREWSQVLHAQAYARNHQGAGAPGHGQFLLIAKLATMLDAREPHEQGGAS